MQTLHVSHSPRDIDVKGAALALLVSILWGANPVAIKIGLADAPPLRLAWMRFLVGGVVVALWAWAGGRLAGLRIERGEWPELGFLGLLFTAQIGLMNVGTSLTSASHSAILLNLYAVHTVVLAHFLIPGDRLRAKKVVGILVAYSGIVRLLRRYRPSALAAFFLTQPIFGVVAAALVAGERLTPDLLLASLAVAAGIGLTTMR
ncbi:MAG TPA: DMT family transporter [Methylomirabilota bacterium]|nr:DMT family transporter [Methylomirabilota bacterium]